VAVVCAGVLGIWPPDYVAAVVAFAFGLAASSFFPAIFLGIFWKRFNMPGAVIGMLCGIGFTTWYILEFKFFGGTSAGWWWGISPEGIGSIGMLLNFAVGIPIALMTAPPPAEVQRMVEDIRIPGSN
jgi:cation/acetate symporter